MEQNNLKKEMTVGAIWCLALGAMIGFGCFVLPGNSFLPEAGPLGTALGLLIGAAMVMVISVSFSYLVRKMPRSGGSFLYASMLFGKGHGFILGWFLLLTYWALVPLNATALGLIGRNLFPGILQRGYLYSVAGFDVYWGEIIVALVFIIGICIVNLLGGKSAGWTQTAITAALVASVLFIVIGVMVSGINVGNLNPAFPREVSAGKAVFSVVAMTPWAFVGFDCIPQAAEEFSFDPRRAMRIMLTAILAAALMYIIVNTCTAIVFPWEEIVSESWATGSAIAATIGNFGLFVVGTAMTCAVISGMNAFLLSASRLMLAMSRVDAIPSFFGKINEKSGVPGNALIFLTILSLAAPFFGREVINWVVDMTSVGASLSFAYACAAAAKLAARNRDRGYCAVAVLGLIFSVFFEFLLLFPDSPGFLSKSALAVLAAWTLIGIAVYLVSRKKYNSSSALKELMDESAL